MSRKNHRTSVIPQSRPQSKKDADARYAELAEMRRHCLSLLLIPTQLAQALKNNEIISRIPDIPVVLNAAQAIAAAIPELKNTLEAILLRADRACANKSIGEDQMFKMLGIYSELHDWTLGYANTVGQNVQLLSSILGPIEQQLSQPGAPNVT